MLRKARLIAPLLRSLLLGAAVVSGVVVSGSALVGCEDENAPETYVKQLKDPAKQRQAIKQLLQMYGDAESKDKKSDDKPNVKALLEKIMGPLTESCLDDKVKDQDRSKLVKFMADTRDPRGEACLKKTLEDYKPDSNEDDVTNVLIAVAGAKMTNLQPQVLKVFQTMEFSRPKAKPLGAHIIKALKVVADKSSEDAFLKMIEPEIPQENSPTAVNQGFWQQTACYMLGHIQSDKAVKPLLKVLLTPAKGPLGSYALLSLVKIGKPAIGPSEALLKGEDAELLKHSEDENLRVAEKDQNGKIPEAAQKAAKKAYLPIAAQVLGNFGSEASAGPLLSALEKVGDDASAKTIIALQLTQIPKSQPTIDAYKKIYEETKLDVEVPGVGPAKERLAMTVSEFYEPSLASWLVKNSAELKGESAEIDPVRSVAFVAAVKLMTFEQLAEVETLKNTKAVTEVQDDKGQTKKKDTTIGESYKEQFELSKGVLEKCKSDVKCFMAQATDEKNHAKDKQFTSIKALYMVGMLGKDAERDQLVDLVKDIKNDDVRNSMLVVINKLTPKGGAAAADKLEGYFEKAEELKDTEKMQQYNVFLQLAAKLRSR